MPTNSNQLSDPRVRQALCMAIDMVTIGETLFEDQIIPADSLLPNGPLKAPNFLITVITLKRLVNF
jgi:ABC-type oligopeptide transport system substrate-binding subunit